MLSLFDWFRKRDKRMSGYKGAVKDYYNKARKEKDIEHYYSCALDYIAWLYEHDLLSINEKENLLQYNEMCKKQAERKIENEKIK